jgi:arsenate reductase
MAEAIVNAQLGDRWEAFSAGSHPSGYVHEFALKVLSEIGIDHHGRSKSMDEFRGMPFDLVVTLCDQAAEECPVWLGSGKRIHLPFPDPTTVNGNDNIKIAAFREVRDALAGGIIQLLNQEKLVN